MNINWQAYILQNFICGSKRLQTFAWNLTQLSHSQAVLFYNNLFMSTSFFSKANYLRLILYRMLLLWRIIFILFMITFCKKISWFHYSTELHSDINKYFSLKCLRSFVQISNLPLFYTQTKKKKQLQPKHFFSIIFIVSLTNWY